jgi:hypothetical protein
MLALNSAYFVLWEPGLRSAIGGDSIFSVAVISAGGVEAVTLLCALSTSDFMSGEGGSSCRMHVMTTGRCP